MKNKLLAKTIAAAMSVAMIGGSISNPVQYNNSIPNAEAAGSETGTAAVINDIWHIGYRFHPNDVVFYKDDNVYNRESDHSIVIENTKSNDSSVEKKFKVEPYTKYRFTAMVKYSVYSDLEKPEAETGASIGFASSYSHSDYVNTDEWTKAEFEFTTKGEKEITLCLRNGIYGNCCKGKAYFSNICLEQIETKKTNKWNILAVAFQQVDISDLEGKERILNKETGVDTQCLTKDDIKLIGNNLKRLKGSLPEMSDGKWDVDSIDFCVVKSSDSGIASQLKGIDTSSFRNAVNYSETSDTVTLTDLKIRNDGVISLDPHTDEIEAIIEPLLKNKEYDHIIFFAPFRNWTGNVQGTGGLFYCDGTNYCQIPCKIPHNYEDEAKKYTADSGYIHELLHGMETRSKSVDPEKTANLHDNLIYGYKENDGEDWQIIDGWKSWYSAYMNSELTGGRGISPSVYLADRTKYTTVVSNDMTANEDEIKYKDAVFSVKPQTVYVKGEDLDLSGAVISGTALKKDIPIKDIDTLDISEFDSKTPGVYTIYADLSSYKKGLKASLDVQVVDKNDVMYGDVNCDGDVTVMDSVLLAKYIADPATDLSILAKHNADVYDPGSGITADDIKAINKYISGETFLPVKTEFLYGDANCDGDVNVEDTTLIRSYLYGDNVWISAQGRINADVYNPGSGLTEDDIDAINKSISGEAVLPVKTELSYGDVNCDGVVDIDDPILLRSYLSGSNVRISAQGKINADVYNPGSGLTEDDIETINRNISGETALPVKTELLYGDVNCDGIVDIEDTILLSSYLNGDKVRISAQGKINADVFNPGTEADIHNPYSYLDKNDVAAIQEFILGNTSLPVVTKRLGDVNCDGNIDKNDSALLRSYLENSLTRISAQGLINADVYDPGAEVNEGDAYFIDRYEFGSLISLPAGVILGDVDYNGKVEIFDYSIIHNHLTGNKPLSEKAAKYADVNCDGSIDVEDEAMIIAHINGESSLNEYPDAATTETTATTTSTTTTKTTTTSVSPEVPIGDVNNDNKLNAVDASTVLSYYANISSGKDGGFSAEQKSAADVNHDGVVNAVDATYILSYYTYVSSTDKNVMSLEEYINSLGV